ncbi:alkaline phosphatase family protein [Rhodococcus sp. NPDC078407]|uniref:alkaline phosphatase family protein n=1 Tax=Rhodococcus sp. NPDC078407 TaxID=3364509 RepID=UPI0037C7427A
MPALTNPNNVSIATGHPPKVHGISGNYIFDTATGEEVLMNDKRFLRAPTVFGAANESRPRRGGGDRKGQVTPSPGGRTRGRGAQHERWRHIRNALSDRHLLLGGEGRSGHCGGERDRKRSRVGWKATTASVSADLSEFALASGVKILETRGADLMYLTLTDYIQHKHAPGTEVANDFYAMIDSYAAKLDALGAVVVLTADHGMSAKTDAAGVTRVVYVEDEVRRILEVASTDANSEGAEGIRVILPITDPYTVHHGALGSFASIYLPGDADQDLVIEQLRTLDGVQAVHTREEAVDIYQQPADRIGDVVLLAEAGTAVGRYAEWHDLSGLDAPLRSHAWSSR